MYNSLTTSKPIDLGTVERLLPCPNPWCTSHTEGAVPNSDDVWQHPAFSPLYRVQCSYCPIKGPTADSEQKAIAAWNTRTPSDMAVRAERRAVARCIEIVRETRDGFLSPEYATDQPISSFNERFACGQCAEAIENEFGMGTAELCQLLDKPTPGELYREILPAAPASENGS